MKDLRQNYYNFIGKMKNFRTKALAALVTALYNYKKFTFRCKNINYPKNTQCIFALWHAHQCGVYAFEDKEKLHIMISKSNDGDIIATATKSLGINVVRGSQSRGGTGATLALIEKIKEGGNAAITIDGPRGPKHVVKKGIVEIARITGVPVVPMIWYSKSKGFLKFKTWDEFRFPLDFINTIALYGDPIAVPNDVDAEGIELYRAKIENELKLLYKTAQRDFWALLKTG